MPEQWMREGKILDWTRVTGATAASGAIVDLATDGMRYESVLFLGNLETTDAQAHLTMEMGTASNDMQEVVGQASGVAPNLFLEVYRPNRFVRGVVGASAGAQNAAVITIGKGSRVQPATNATTVVGTFLGYASGLTTGAASA